MRVSVRALVASSTSWGRCLGAWAFLTKDSSISSRTLSNCFLVSLNFRTSLGASMRQVRAQKSEEGCMLGSQSLSTLCFSLAFLCLPAPQSKLSPPGSPATERPCPLPLQGQPYVVLQTHAPNAGSTFQGNPRHPSHTCGGPGKGSLARAFSSALVTMGPLATHSLMKLWSCCRTDLWAWSNRI